MSYKIKATLNVPKIAEYVNTHPEFLHVGKEDNKYANISLYTKKEVDRFGYDCSLSLKKEKGSTEKTVYVGNGKTPDIEKKIAFANDSINARIAKKILENPFTEGSISLSINMTTVKKELLKHPQIQNEYGDIAIDVFVNNHVNDFGNDVSVALEKEFTYSDTIYIGNGKTPAAWGEQSKPKTETTTETIPSEEDTIPPLTNDDLPF